MSNLLKSLQDARTALLANHAKQLSQLDETIALFSNMASSPAAAIETASTEKSTKSKPGPKPKGEESAKPKAAKPKDKIRLNSKQVEQDGLKVLEGNSHEVFTLDQVADKVVTMQGINPMFHTQVKRALYLAFVKLHSTGNIKKTKKEGNNKVDYYSI